MTKKDIQNADLLVWLEDGDVNDIENSGKIENPKPVVKDQIRDLPGVEEVREFKPADMSKELLEKLTEKTGVPAPNGLEKLVDKLASDSNDS